LKDNPALADTIEQKIKIKLGVGVPRAVADLPVEEAVKPKAAKVANDA
jgi:recombination protein RecA